MLPPAPVTSTTLPASTAPMPASSSCTGSRPSRSSGSMSRSCRWRLAAAQFGGCWAPSAPAGRWRRPAPARWRRCAGLAAGMATITCVAAPRTRLVGNAPPAAPAPARRRCARPAWRGRRRAGPAPPALLVDAGQQQPPASPAPSTMARRRSRRRCRCMRARVLVEHAVDHAHQGQAHQRDHRVQASTARGTLAAGPASSPRWRPASRPRRRPAPGAAPRRSR
jgi:hypothetical protein